NTPINNTLALIDNTSAPYNNTTNNNTHDNTPNINNNPLSDNTTSNTNLLPNNTSNNNLPPPYPAQSTTNPSHQTTPPLQSTPPRQSTPNPSCQSTPNPPCQNSLVNQYHILLNIDPTKTYPINKVKNLDPVLDPSHIIGHDLVINDHPHPISIKHAIEDHLYPIKYVIVMVEMRRQRSEQEKDLSAKVLEVFSHERLPPLKSTASAAEIIQWKESLQVDNCYRALFEKNSEGVFGSLSLQELPSA
ncbi:17445_t:CDS:2, partial [Gigaspora margarita]